MLKDYKNLAFKEGNGVYFCCSCGKRWTVKEGKPLADVCPSCGTKLKYEDIPMPPHGEWISTDVDCTQYRRDASEKGEGVFELYQVNQYSEDLCHIAHGFVYPEDYDPEQNEELVTAYGWPQEVMDSPEFPALMAEAVFESSGTEYDTETEYTSFEEASKIIGATIGVDVFDFI